MAQRTGDQRLLASPARAASAGALPALALAALLAVSGCGGDSAAQTASAPSSSSTAAEQTKSSAAAESAASDSPKKKDPGSKSAGAQGPAGEGKHGTAPVLPAEGKAPEPEPTPAELANAAVASIALQSPALASEGSLPAPYTCDGGNSSPPLVWQGVPAGTRELVLFAMNVQPVGGRLFFDWAVGGLDPSLQSIEADELPKGAVVGQNSFGKRGYSLCPAEASETYMFALYALPKRLSPSPGFDPRSLREAVLEVSGNVGLMPATYARG